MRIEREAISRVRQYVGDHRIQTLKRQFGESCVRCGQQLVAIAIQSASGVGNDTLQNKHYSWAENAIIRLLSQIKTRTQEKCCGCRHGSAAVNRQGIFEPLAAGIQTKQSAQNVNQPTTTMQIKTGTAHANTHTDANFKRKVKYRIGHFTVGKTGKPASTKHVPTQRLQKIETSDTEMRTRRQIQCQIAGRQVCSPLKTKHTHSHHGGLCCRFFGPSRKQRYLQERVMLATVVTGRTPPQNR